MPLQTVCLPTGPSQPDLATDLRCPRRSLTALIRPLASSLASSSVKLLQKSSVTDERSAISAAPTIFAQDQEPVTS